MTSTATRWSETRRRLIPAMIIGTTLEWYEMFLYAAAAALVFGPLFFPSADPIVGIAASFATFGVGYLARPLGAIVFGHIGDRFGRRHVLVATLVLMGAATMIIGILPTYATVGALAPILLVLMRLLQGLAAGAEYAGALTLVAEAAPARSRGFFAALPGTGIYLGIIISSAVSAIAFSAAGDSEWAWRIPFLASGVLVVVGVWIRLGIGESPVFSELEKEKEVRKAPVVEVFRTSKVRLLQTILLTGSIGLAAPMVLSYSLVFSRSVGTEGSVALVGTLIGAAAGVICVPLAGSLTDRFGRKPVYIALAITSAIFPFMFFALLATGQDVMVFVAHFLAAPMVWAVTGVQAAYLAELFPAGIRLSGVALSRELSNAIFAAPGPLIAVGLASLIGGQPWLGATLMAVVALLGLISLFTLPETRGIEMAYDDESGVSADTPPQPVAR